MAHRSSIFYNDGQEFNVFGLPFNGGYEPGLPGISFDYMLTTNTGTSVQAKVELCLVNTTSYGCPSVQLTFECPEYMELDYSTFPVVIVEELMVPGQGPMGQIAIGRGLAV